MKTVKQVSAVTGVSIRTLHHYDAIGLLKPAEITESGYRLYDDAALKRLHSILLLRELKFSLKEIGEILDSPGFDPMGALEQQITLLQMQRDHLDTLIAHARQLQKTGGNFMSFTAFDTSEQDRCAAEAKTKWGNTEPYREFEQKTAGKSRNQLNDAGAALMEIFAEMGKIRHLSPESAEAQALVKKLQAHITANFYTCTKPILRGLGQMYTAGDSMTDNINASGGEGTADFAARAIEIYCRA